MAYNLTDDEYVALLEEAISSGPSNEKPAGDRFPGIDYHSVPIHGDDILNWGGEDEKEDINTSTENMNDVMENVFPDDDSPVSILELDDRGMKNHRKSLSIEEDSSYDLNENILTEKESDAISCLINEMNLMEDSEIGDEDDDDDDIPRDQDEVDDIELSLDDDDDDDDSSSDYFDDDDDGMYDNDDD